VTRLQRQLIRLHLLFGRAVSHNGVASRCLELALFCPGDGREDVPYDPIGRSQGQSRFESWSGHDVILWHTGDSDKYVCWSPGGGIGRRYRARSETKRRASDRWPALSTDDVVAVPERHYRPILTCCGFESRPGRKGRQG